MAETKLEQELEVLPDGTIRTIYSDELQKFTEDIGGELATVCRASNVEWEKFPMRVDDVLTSMDGWVVRAAHDPNLALRVQRHAVACFGPGPMDALVCSRDTNLALALFARREDAIAKEVEFFFELLPPKESRESK